MSYKRRSNKERFLKYVGLEEGYLRPGMATKCRLWMGARDGDDSGRFNVRKKTLNAAGRPWRKIRAARFAFKLKHGRYPKKGLLACHNCNNPSCVNGDHIREDTHQNNMRDMTRAGRQCRGERMRKLTVASLMKARKARTDLIPKRQRQIICSLCRFVVVEGGRLIQRKGLTFKQIARWAGISDTSVRNIFKEYA